MFNGNSACSKSNSNAVGDKNVHEPLIWQYATRGWQ
jgi:hypothetical protein